MKISIVAPPPPPHANTTQASAVSASVQRALLSLVIAASFSSANAGSVFLDGQSVEDRVFNQGDNVVAGRYFNSKDKIEPDFDTNLSIDSTFNKVTVQGGDLILGNYAYPNEKAPLDFSLNSISVVVSNSKIEENLVLGSKVVAYANAQPYVSNIKEARLTLENSTVDRSVVIGQLVKSSAKEGSASLEKVTVNISNSTVGGLFVGPVLYHMKDDNTPGSTQSMKLGEVEITITNSTVKALKNKDFGFENVNYQGAAIFMGGAAGDLADYEVINTTSVGKVSLKIAESNIQGDVYMGAASHDESSKATVEEARLVLGAGTNISGAIHTGGGSASESASSSTVNSSIEKSTIILDSTNVKITNGVSQDSATSAKIVHYEGTGAFNDENASARESLEQLRTILGLSDEVEDIEIAEGESNGAISGDGAVTLNTKTERIGRTTALNVLTWRLEMNDMNKRLGELRDNKGQTGLWTRVNGGKMKFMGEKNNFQQFQFGADHKIDSLAGIRLGAAFSFTNSDLDYADGSGDNKIYGLAGYGSWLGENGSFVDVIAKIARLESDSTVDQTHSDFNTTAYSFSAEIGHRFNLAPAFIEPQLELSYGHVSGKTFDTVNRVTNIAANTTVEAVDSLVGRAGLRAGLTCPQQKGGAYLHFSVLHEFDGDVVVRRGDGAYQQDMGDTWVEYGIGGNYNFTPFTQLYADVERTSGADLSEPWRVNVGLRHSF